MQEEEWARAAQIGETISDQQAAEPTAPAWPVDYGGAGPSSEGTPEEIDGRVSYPTFDYVRPRAPPKTAPSTLPRPDAAGNMRR